MNENNLLNIKTETLKIYFFNELSKIWEEIPSFFNPSTKNITTNVNHLSWFAVFGEKIDTTPPTTHINVSGTQVDGWFTSYPLVEFSYLEETSGPIQTFYSIDLGDNWDLYKNPFLIEKDGITNLLFKSQDTLENIEKENSYVIQVNHSEKVTKRIKVKNASYSSNY